MDKFDRIRTRQLKIRYTHLNKPERRLIKLREKEHQLEKDIDGLWAEIGRKQPPPYRPDNTGPEVQDMIDLVLGLTRHLDKVRTAKDRHIARHVLDEDRIALVHMLANIGPGGSY